MPFQFPEEEEKSSGFTMRQVWCMVRAHLWLSMGVFAVLVAVAFVMIKRMPKSYDATAKLIVSVDNNDPLANRNIQSGAFFSTQIELINDAAVLRPVIDRLQLEKDIRFNGEYAGGDPKVLNDIVLAKLRSSLRVQPGSGGSQLLYISASSPDSALSANIANAVAEEFIRQTTQRTNAPAAQQAERYNERLADLKRKRDETQAREAAFRERYGMVELGQGADPEGAVLADLQTKVQQAQNQVRLLEGQQVDVRTDGVLVQETPETAALRTRLETIKDELDKASATFGPNYPKVVQLQKDYDSTRATLQAAISRQQTQARDQLRKLQAELERERARMLDRRELQDQGLRVVAEHRMAEEQYAAALRGLDPVQFAARGNYQDVTLVSPAEPPLRASAQNKLKKLLAAMVVIFGLAFGGPFAYELLFDRRIRCRDDLERGFRLVTLAEFGRMVPVPRT